MTDMVSRKILMQPFKPQGWSAAAVLIGLTGASIGFLFIQGGGIGVILSLGVFLATFVLSTAVGQAARPGREKKIMANITADTRKAMIDYIGREPKYIHTQGCASRSHAGCVVGTGIAYDGQNIFIMDDGEIGQIPWSLVRSWQWSIEGYSSVRIYSAGVPAAAAASAQFKASDDNARASVNAKRVSGFFLSVADIEKPDWQFTCWDKATLTKWNEIFTQLKEGRLQAA